MASITSEGQNLHKLLDDKEKETQGDKAETVERPDYSDQFYKKLAELEGMPIISLFLGEGEALSQPVP